MTQMVEDLCTAIEEQGDRVWERKDLVDLGVGNTTLGCIPKLIEKGYIALEGSEHDRPQHFRTLKSPLPDYKAGTLGSLYPQYRPKGKETKATVQEAAPPPEPLPTHLEIDPIEVFEQLEEEEMASLIVTFIKLKNAQIGPLRERIVMLAEELNDVRNGLNSDMTGLKINHQNEVNSLNSRINSLQEELKLEKEKVMNLRAELTSQHENRIREEAPVRTIVIERSNQPAQRDSGASQARPGGVRVGARPYVGEHPAKAVTDSANKPIIEFKRK
jgi:hypothetical protein